MFGNWQCVGVYLSLLKLALDVGFKWLLSVDEVRLIWKI